MKCHFHIHLTIHEVTICIMLLEKAFRRGRFESSEQIAECSKLMFVSVQDFAVPVFRLYLFYVKCDALFRKRLWFFRE